MPKEIERKFRLARVPSWLSARDGDEIEQGYLAFNEHSEIRLRRRDGELTLTVKRGRGESRDEFEFRLDRELFDRLWTVTEGKRLAKCRTVVALDDGLQAEVDVYGGRLEGLVVVEVEFGSEDASGHFQPPSWFGAEVTGDHRYANQSLALATQAPAIGIGDGGNIESVDRDDRNGPSRAYRLKRKEAPAAGLRRIAEGRRRQAIGHLRDAERGVDVAESIHAARKDLKKLRAALRLVRDGVGGSLYKAENERYREAARLLSGTRDAQVKSETLEALLEHASADAATLQVAETWMRALRSEDERASERARGGEEVAAALELLQEPGVSWPRGKRSWTLVAPGLTRAYGRGRKAMRAAADGDPDEVHRWRKRAKDLWYHQRILQVVWPQEMESAAELSHELGDLLGDHHDLTVLTDDLRGRDFSRGDRRVLEKAIAARQRDLLGQALDLGAHIYVEKPKAFAKRIRGYWKLWDPPRG